MSGGFQPVMIDDSPRLLEESYQLRYQVYCLERQFLRAEDHQNQQEADEFDRDSIHLGVVDANGCLAATARIITAGLAGLPLLRHCTLFPQVTVDELANTVVEVSRVAISRNYSRRRRASSLGPPAIADCDAPASVPPGAERRRRRGEPFVTLLHAIIHGARHLGATHLIGATDAALHRWLVHYGFPYRVVGPEVDYYGLVAPHHESGTRSGSSVGNLPRSKAFPSARAGSLAEAAGAELSLLTAPMGRRSQGGGRPDAVSEHRFLRPRWRRRLASHPLRSVRLGPADPVVPAAQDAQSRP